MALFYIDFKLIIKQKHPSEEIHIIEFSRRLEDEHCWDPLPQIGSTVLIPLIVDRNIEPLFGTHSIDKTPCRVVDIVHELNGHFSYSKTYVVCEAKCDLTYIMSAFHCEDLAGFIGLIEACGWSVNTSPE